MILSDAQWNRILARVSRAYERLPVKPGGVQDFKGLFRCTFCKIALHEAVQVKIEVFTKPDPKDSLYSHVEVCLDVDACELRRAVGA